MSANLAASSGNHPRSKAGKIIHMRIVIKRAICIQNAKSPHRAAGIDHSSRHNHTPLSYCDPFPYRGLGMNRANKRQLRTYFLNSPGYLGTNEVIANGHKDSLQSMTILQLRQILLLS